MGDTPNTDEQRLAEFSNKLDSFKPEGFDETQFAALKEAVIGFHNDEVKGLKINTAKMKEEKENNGQSIPYLSFLQSKDVKRGGKKSIKRISRKNK